MYVLWVTLAFIVGLLGFQVAVKFLIQQKKHKIVFFSKFHVQETMVSAVP